MTSIKSLLEQSQDVEKLADNARHDGKLLSPFEQDLWINGFKSRDAEVEKLKQALIVMWEALEQHHKEFRYSGSEETFCLAECSTTCKALAKAREILGGGENGKD